MQFFTGMPQNWFGFDEEGVSHVDLEVRRYTKVSIIELRADTNITSPKEIQLLFTQS